MSSPSVSSLSIPLLEYANTVVERREMILQFSLSHLGSGNPALAARISHVGDVNNMLQ